MFKTLVSWLCSIVLMCLGSSVWAQGTSIDPSSKETSGFKFVINGIKTLRDRVVVQVVVQNTNKTRQYLIVYTRAVALDSGAVGEIFDISGMAHCPGSWSSTEAALKACREGIGRQLGDYTYIEPGDFASVSFTFGNFRGDVATGRNISFNLIALARTGAPQQDPTAAVEEKSVSAPRVINANFALVPINK